jgi:hypothetical protein
MLAGSVAIGVKASCKVSSLFLLASESISTTADGWTERALNGKISHSLCQTTSTSIGAKPKFGTNLACVRFLVREQ